MTGVSMFRKFKRQTQSALDFRMGSRFSHNSIVAMGCAALAIMVTVPGIAMAQSEVQIIKQRDDPRRGETVSGRPRPELDAIGVRVGAFLVNPKLVVEEQFTDNVFATKRRKLSDQVTVLQPDVEMRSTWSRHALLFKSRATVGIHASETAEDYEDHEHFVDGRIDLSRNTVIRLYSRY
jgi:hypothetical protein